MIVLAVAVLTGAFVFLVVIALWEHRYHTAATVTLRQFDPPITIHISEEEARQLLYALPAALMAEDEHGPLVH